MSDNENLTNNNNNVEENDSVEESPSERSHGRLGGRRKLVNQHLQKTDVELYKDVETLRRFLTERGQIRPRRQTGLAAHDQRRLAVAVKRARHLALLPFVAAGGLGRHND
jgi:small subunit ribosomal protein S18